MFVAFDEVPQKQVQAEREIVKSELTSVGKLMVDFPGAVPIEPGTTNVSRYGTPLPEAFVVTRIQPNTYGSYTMHYYAPKTGQRSFRDVPKDFELKILTGAEGDALRAAWKTASKDRLGDMARRMVCTLGTDPEIFAVKNDEVVPAWTFLPGKEAPKKYKLHNREGAVYWDGFQAEFTTQGSDTCLLWVSDNIQGGLKTINEAAKKVGAKLTIENVLPVNPDVLQGESIEHVQFGCAPSYNAYGLTGNIEDGRNVPFRFAGGHLHFGINNLTKEPEKRQATIQKYVKALDRVLGVASVSLLGELDNPIRRKFYGLPGEYRMPVHGFEYRTLSNAWLCHPLAMNMVFDLARSVCGVADEDLLGPWDVSEQDAIEIVINNDIPKAREALDRNKVMFKHLCKVITGYHYVAPEHLELAFKTWRNGIDSVVKDPKDIVGNWTLEGQWITHGDGYGKNWEKAYNALAIGDKV
jgi:hypothetical protein